MRVAVAEPADEQAVAVARPGRRGAVADLEVVELRHRLDARRETCPRRWPDPHQDAVVAEGERLDRRLVPAGQLVARPVGVNVRRVEEAVDEKEVAGDAVNPLRLERRRPFAEDGVGVAVVEPPREVRVAGAEDRQIPRQDAVLTIPRTITRVSKTKSAPSVPRAAAVVRSLVLEARMRGWSASTAKALWRDDRSTMWTPSARELLRAASISRARACCSVGAGARRRAGCPAFDAVAEAPEGNAASTSAATSRGQTAPRRRVDSISNAPSLRVGASLR